MSKTRLEAFSDGVIAILITIMVLDLKPPEGTGWEALRNVAVPLLTYVMSFVYLGIYWNNHHHLLHATTRINGTVLWANLHLLFWLSLVPFVTKWMGEHHYAPLPTAMYGLVLFCSGVAYLLLERSIIHGGGGEKLAKWVGQDRKGQLSMVLYAASVPLAFVSQWLSGAIFVTVAVIWLVPDRRIESHLQE